MTMTSNHPLLQAVSPGEKAGIEDKGTAEDDCDLGIFDSEGWVIYIDGNDEMEEEEDNFWDWVLEEEGDEHEAEAHHDGAEGSGQGEGEDVPGAAAEGEGDQEHGDVGAPPVLFCCGFHCPLAIILLLFLVSVIFLRPWCFLGACDFSFLLLLLWLW